MKPELKKIYSAMSWRKKLRWRFRNFTPRSIKYRIGEWSKVLWSFRPITQARHLAELETVLRAIAARERFARSRIPDPDLVRCSLVVPDMAGFLEASGGMPRKIEREFWDDPAKAANLQAHAVIDQLRSGKTLQ